jgi:hypothetical protein
MWLYSSNPLPQTGLKIQKSEKLQNPLPTNLLDLPLNKMVKHSALPSGIARSSRKVKKVLKFEEQLDVSINFSNKTL